MTRIDDARAAEIGLNISSLPNTMVAPISVGTVRSLLADRADYKARIEEMTRELAKAQALSDLAGANGAKFALIASAGGMSDKEIEERLTPGRKAALEVLKDLRTQLPTPSPTDAPACLAAIQARCGSLSGGLCIYPACGCDPIGYAKPTDAPASDTRGLAVEIVRAVVSAKHALQGDPYFDAAVDAAESVLRKVSPSASNTDRKLARAVEALRDVRTAIETADPEILTDTLFMPDHLCMGATVVDYIALELEAAASVATAPAEAETAPDIKPIVEALDVPMPAATEGKP